MRILYAGSNCSTNNKKNYIHAHTSIYASFMYAYLCIHSILDLYEEMYMYKNTYF